MYSLREVLKCEKCNNTPFLSATAESTLKSSLMKTWSAKPHLAEKSLNVRPADAYYITWFTPVEILTNWYSPVIFWTSRQCVLILPQWYHSDSLWCLLGSHRDHNNPWWLFSLKYQVRFLGYDRLVFIRFY